MYLASSSFVFRGIMSLSKTNADLIDEGPRSTKGCRPIRNFIESPSALKKAQGLRWIFYHKYDPNPFVLADNSSYYPWREISIADKLSMIKGHKINFKSTDTGMFRASFVKMVPAAEVQQFVADVSWKIANSNKSLSDISSIALVHKFSTKLICSIRDKLIL